MRAMKEPGTCEWVHWTPTQAARRSTGSHNVRRRRSRARSAPQRESENTKRARYVYICNLAMPKSATMPILLHVGRRVHIQHMPLDCVCHGQELACSGTKNSQLTPVQSFVNRRTASSADFGHAVSSRTWLPSAIPQNQCRVQCWSHCEAARGQYA